MATYIQMMNGRDDLVEDLQRRASRAFLAATHTAGDERAAHLNEHARLESLQRRLDALRYAGERSPAWDAEFARIEAAA